MVMIGKLFANTIYVKIYRNRLDLRQIESGDDTTVTASAPFSTERLLIGQFAEAAEGLSTGIKELRDVRWYAPGPSVIMHPMEMIEGGLSQVEDRVLGELATEADARIVSVWVGHELSDVEVLSKARS